MTDDARTFFHGTREKNLVAGEQVPLNNGFVYFSPSLDDAIWGAELAAGSEQPRVLVVTPTGPIERAESKRAPHPTMSWRTRAPMKVVGEVNEWAHYHGTKANLRAGDLIEPGQAANFGSGPRKSNFVYFTRTHDAAAWGAELAVGDGPERVFVVEPTGRFEQDPNLTDMKFRGNPTKSFRSREPLRVARELEDWPRHPVDAVRAMRAGLAKLAEQGTEPDDG